MPNDDETGARRLAEHFRAIVKSAVLLRHHEVLLELYTEQCGPLDLCVDNLREAAEILERCCSGSAPSISVEQSVKNASDDRQPSSGSYGGYTHRMPMWDPFTDRASRSIVLAQDEAERMGNRYIGTNHLLLGILAEAQNEVAQALFARGITKDSARNAAAKYSEKPDGQVNDDMAFTTSARHAIENAVGLTESRSDPIDTIHIFRAITELQESTGSAILTDLGVDASEVCHGVLQKRKGEFL